MLNNEAKQQLAEWLNDRDWIEKEKYELDAEYVECVQDILEHPLFKSMDQFIQHGRTTTKTHCIQVSFLSYNICKKAGWNYCSAARAGLLHDFYLYDWHYHAKTTGEHFHGFTHPGKALKNAKKYFPLTPMEEDIILRHMWPLTPVPPKSLEGLTIVYADKVCGAVEVSSHIKNLLVGEYYGIFAKVFK